MCTDFPANQRRGGKSFTNGLSGEETLIRSQVTHVIRDWREKKTGENGWLLISQYSGPHQNQPRSLGRGVTFDWVVRGEYSL